MGNPRRDALPRVRVFTYCMGQNIAGIQKREKVESNIGFFHQWGSDFEEFESGPGNFTTAIVELDDGEIITPTADMIQFI